MEGFLDQIIAVAVPLVAAGVTALAAYGVSQIRKLVKATENQYDDKLLAAFEAGLEKGLHATPAEQPASQPEQPASE